jgi:katanin p60 ATPase-containing subunit A1
MKTELLMQMDGLKGSGKLSEQVFVMAASNLPWDLDVAMLRRFDSHLIYYSSMRFSPLRLEKRVMVPLPCTEAREYMIRNHLEGRCSDATHYSEVWDTIPGILSL